MEHRRCYRDDTATSTTFNGPTARAWRWWLIASPLRARPRRASSFVVLGKQGVGAAGRLLPERLVAGDPARGLTQGRAVQPEAMRAAFDDALDETRVFEHLEVLGDGRLG